MSILIGLLNVTLTAATAVLVLLARERLGLGDRLIGWVTATWTIRIGLLVESGTHLCLATSRDPYLVGFILFAATWRVFDRATVSQAYAEPAAAQAP